MKLKQTKLASRDRESAKHSSSSARSETLPLRRAPLPVCIRSATLERWAIDVNVF